MAGSGCKIFIEGVRNFAWMWELLFTIPDDLWGGCCITLTEVSKMCQQLPGIVGSSIAWW